MAYSPYHTGFNLLVRNHRSSFGAYDVSFMCEGAWLYIMDDYGNAVPVPIGTHQAELLFNKVGI